MYFCYLLDFDVLMGVLVDVVYLDKVMDDIVCVEGEGVWLLLGGWCVEVEVGGSYV